MDILDTVCLVVILVCRMVFAAQEPLRCPALVGNNSIICQNANLTTANELDFKALLPEITILDISNNWITPLRSKDFFGYGKLLSLNLSRNKIEFMEFGAFDGLDRLVTLDLSFNKLSIILPTVLNGLDRLKWLDLSGNPLTQIMPGSFNSVPSLTHLDISGASLICDCGLSWLPDWVRQKRIFIPETTTCFTPFVLRNQKVKGLKKDDYSCDYPIEIPYMVLTPNNTRITAINDSITYTCSATNVVQGGTATTQIFWFHNEIAVNFSYWQTKFSHDEGIKISTININRISPEDDGSWTCSAWTSRGHRNATVRLHVLHDKSPVCQPNITVTSRGIYRWPRTFAKGVTEYLQCEGSDDKSHRVKHVCDEHGTWGSLDVSSCPYTAEFSRALQQHIETQFSNVGILRIYLLNQSAEKEVTEPDQVHLILQALEKFIKEKPTKPAELAEFSADVGVIIDWVLDVPFIILKEGVGLKFAERILFLLRSVAISAVGAEKFRTTNYAVATTLVDIIAPRGTMCEVRGDYRDRSLELTCSTDSGKWGAMSSHQSLGRVHIPFLKPEHLNLNSRLLVFAFRNVKLFASVLRKEQTPSSMLMAVFPEIGVKKELPGGSSEAVIVELEIPLLSGNIQPLLLSDSMELSDDICKVSSINIDTGMVKLACSSFGAVMITQPFDLLSAYYSGNLALHIPVVIYFAVGFVVLVHIFLLILYATFFVALSMIRSYKHCLLNLWWAVDALLVVFVCGLNETTNREPCNVMGVALHYFSLCVMLWILTGFYCLWRHVRRSSQRPQHHAGIKDAPGEGVHKRRPSVGGLYLFAWGVPVIIPGISAAVNLQFYGNYRYCFLRTPHSFLAVFAPGVVIAALCVLFFLLVMCTKGSGRQRDAEASLGQLLRPSSSQSDPRFDKSHAVTLFVFLIIFVALYGTVGFWTADFFVDRIQRLRTVYEYLVAFLLFLLGLHSLFKFWLLRKDLPKTCWAAEKKMPESVASRTIVPVMESYDPVVQYAPPGSYTPSTPHYNTSATYVDPSQNGTSLITRDGTAGTRRGSMSVSAATDSMTVVAGTRSPQRGYLPQRFLDQRGHSRADETAPLYGESGFSGLYGTGSQFQLSELRNGRSASRHGYTSDNSKKETCI